MEGHSSSWGSRGAQYAAELRILLVYLNESLGRLGQNGGHIFHWGAMSPWRPVELPMSSWNIVSQRSFMVLIVFFVKSFCFVQVSERDLRLTYLPPFKACIDAGTYNLMCSFYRFCTAIVSLCCVPYLDGHCSQY